MYSRSMHCIDIYFYACRFGGLHLSVLNKETTYLLITCIKMKWHTTGCSWVSECGFVNTEQNAAYAQKLLQHIGRHLLDGQWCDTVIVTDDGRLSAHSVVLAAASPVFKAALRVTDRPREHVVVLPGIKSSLMKTILQFVYTGEIVPLPKDTATFLSLLLDLQLVRLELVENRLSFFLLILFAICLSSVAVSCVFTTQCYADRGIDTAGRPPVCLWLEVSRSQVGILRK